jgi:hypothetical protein
MAKQATLFGRYRSLVFQRGSLFLKEAAFSKIEEGASDTAAQAGFLR